MEIIETPASEIVNPLIIDELDPKTQEMVEEIIAKEPQQPLHVVSEIPIIMENFELLKKKYRPLMWRYIRLVHNMHNKSVEFDDLEQEADWALWNSIKNFDDTRNVFFPVYLGKAVLNRLLCYCRNYLPHFYKKDPEKEGKFKRVKVNVDTLDDPNTYNF